MTEIWILGAAGRSGRGIAAALARRQARMVLVGRDGATLQGLADEIGVSARTVVLDSVEAMADAIGRSGPVVVMNTVGPFTRTAAPIARACARGGAYVDLSNELTSFIETFAMQDEAVAAGRRLVVGAGYGVLATESLVLKLCEGRPPAARVRTDTAPFVDAAGAIGHTLAATIVESVPVGGRRYEGGRLVRAGAGGERETLTAPDGTQVSTGLFPSGDLEAARRASGAPSAVSASTMAPSGALVRALLPAASAVFASQAVRAFATRRLAGVKLEAAKAARPSWTHARVEWADGAVREGWLRAADAMDFTVEAAAEVCFRLAQGEGSPGAYTPGALFGPDLAVAAGGTFMI